MSPERIEEIRQMALKRLERARKGERESMSDFIKRKSQLDPASLHDNVRMKSTCDCSKSCKCKKEPWIKIVLARR